MNSTLVKLVASLYPSYAPTLIFSFLFRVPPSHKLLLLGGLDGLSSSEATALTAKYEKVDIRHQERFRQLISNEIGKQPEWLSDSYSDFLGTIE